MKKGIFFIHRSPVPPYLVNAIDNTKAFNPETPIYLLLDKKDLVPLTLKKIGVICVTLDQLEDKRHEHFLAIYQHISGNDIQFERFCISRWFYLEAAMKLCNVQEAIHLDSDAMLFTSFEEFSGYFKDYEMAISENCGHCAYFCGLKSLTHFNDYVIRFFENQENIDLFQKRKNEGAKIGKKEYLSDMTLLGNYQKENPSLVANYKPITKDWFVDNCIQEDDGYVMKTKKKRRPFKKIFWEQQDKYMIPYCERSDDGRRVRALALHFKGGGKRYMSQYNSFIHTNKLLRLYQILMAKHNLYKRV